MIRNGTRLLESQPLHPMVPTKIREHGVSWGLSEAGYDIRIKQDVRFVPAGCEWTPPPMRRVKVATKDHVIVDGKVSAGRFTLASSVERFTIPTDLVGIVHDKSTFARKGLSVFNTVCEPGWGLKHDCWLTLELVYHGSEVLHIPAGAGIAQVIFHETTNHMDYGDGKYANQPDHPVGARAL